MDADEMHGDLNKRMAEGVQGAAVVVVFMTQKYEESHSCNKELNYADNMQKRIVPVKLDPKYEPGLALGLIMAGKLYTVFSDESQFESNFAALKKEIDAAHSCSDTLEGSIEELEKSRYKTWMDVDQMHGGLNDRMAEAVEGAAVVVVFMTQKYEKSRSYNKELNYVENMRKNIVPVKFDPEYKPSKALGTIVAGKLHTVFSDTSRFNSRLAALKKEIDAALGKNSFS
eukprot:gene1421-1573_t